MLPRLARCAAIATAAAVLSLMPPQLSSAQTPPPASAPSPPAAAAGQNPAPGAATQSKPPAPGAPSPPAAAESKPGTTPPQQPSSIPPEGITTKPTDAFGEDAILTGKPIVYVKGSGTWDKAFATISGALKKVEAYVAKAGLKTDGLPMTIFLATDDRGFDYEAAVPLAEPPKEPPHGEITLGQSPDGHALKFVHRGSYDALDDTYEAITNYLDEKRLESKNVLIEQYVTDPATADEKNLVINIFVLVD